MLGETQKIVDNAPELGGGPRGPWQISSLQAACSHQVVQHFGGDVDVHAWYIGIFRGSDEYLRFTGIATSKEDVLEEIAEKLRATRYFLYTGESKERRSLESTDFVFGVERDSHGAIYEVYLKKDAPFKIDPLCGECCVMSAIPTKTSELKFKIELNLD